MMIVDQAGATVVGASVIAYRNPLEAQVRAMRPGEEFTPEILFVERSDAQGVVDLPELPERRSDYTLLVSGESVLPESVFVDEITDEGSVLAGRGGAVGRIEVTRVRSKRRVVEQCRTVYSAATYKKLADASPSTTVGNLYSRSKNAKVSFKWVRGSDISLGVGIEYSYKAGARATTTRQVANTVDVSFPDLASKGQRIQKTAAYYVKWQLTQTVATVCGSSTKYEKRTWVEWRPEGLNGTSQGSVKIDLTPPAPPNRNWCGWMRKGDHMTVARGTATRTDAALSLGGFSLSAQAGHNENISVKIKADTGPIWACGYAGPAASDPGHLVAIPG